MHDAVDQLRSQPVTAPWDNRSTDMDIYAMSYADTACTTIPMIFISSEKSSRAARWEARCCF